MSSLPRFIRHYAEMVVAMFLPTFAVVGLLWGKLVEDIGTLLVIEHVAMLLSMLVAMLLRRPEYTGHGHRLTRQQVAA